MENFIEVGHFFLAWSTDQLPYFLCSTIFFWGETYVTCFFCLVIFVGCYFCQDSVLETRWGDRDAYFSAGCRMRRMRRMPRNITDLLLEIAEFRQQLAEQKPGFYLSSNLTHWNNFSCFFRPWKQWSIESIGSNKNSFGSIISLGDHHLQKNLPQVHKSTVMWVKHNAICTVPQPSRFFIGGFCLFPVMEMAGLWALCFTHIFRYYEGTVPYTCSSNPNHIPWWFESTDENKSRHVPSVGGAVAPDAG